jgi:hypothetical protein
VPRRRQGIRVVTRPLLAADRTIRIDAPTRIETFLYEGHTIRAPGFDEESFAIAVGRALAEGLTAQPGKAPRTWLVTNPATNSEYVAHGRYGCSCASGHHRSLCKHRAVVLLVEAITGGVDRPGGRETDGN